MSEAPNKDALREIKNVITVWYLYCDDKVAYSLAYAIYTTLPKTVIKSVISFLTALIGE